MAFLYAVVPEVASGGIAQIVVDDTIRMHTLEFAGRSRQYTWRASFSKAPIFLGRGVFGAVGYGRFL